MKEKLIARVELPERQDYIYDNAQLFVRCKVYKKWYQFWKNDYEELPLLVTHLESKTEPNP